MPTVLRRSFTRLALVAVVFAAVLVADGPATGVAPRPARSAPVWLPVHTAFGLDCAGHNPGCTARRPFFSIDVVPAGQFNAHGHPSHARVFAMGGGTVHIGDAHGSRCGSGHSFGTWVWIEHGNHTYSRYGHLSKILVKGGTRVAAGTAIGVVGATGKGGNCQVNYVDFEVEHGKQDNDHATGISTLRACGPAGRRQDWPRQAASTKSLTSHKRVHFATWNKVRRGTQFPASTGSCIP